MIEQKLEALTAAIVALTATIAAAAGSAPAAAAPAVEKATAKTEKATAKTEKATKTEKAAASKHTRSEINAALNEVKENFDTASAKAIIKGAGFDKMADITEDKFDSVYEACKAKMAELSAGDDGDGDDDGM